MQDRIPLSSGQRRMWFWRQLAPETALYNLATTVEILGPLDAQSLESSLQDLSQRHEILRCRWLPAESGTFQRIERSSDWRMRRLQVDPGHEGECSLQALTAAEAARPFDLTCESGMRASLICVSPEKHCLVWTFDHSVCDGWAVGVLLDELCKVYESKITGRPAELPEIAVPFSEYVLREQQVLAGGLRARELAYWKSQLAGAPSMLDWHTDVRASSVSGFRQGSLPFDISSSEMEALRGVAKRNRCTPFMVLLAAWQILLHRHTGQSAVLTGSVIANRDRELSRLVGYLANTVALRTNFPESMSVHDLLLQVRAAVLGAYEHRHVPFEEVVETLEDRRQGSRTPLIQTMLVLDPPFSADRQVGPLRLRGTPRPSGVARFELVLSLRESGDALCGHIEYKADLFDAATIAAMAGHLRVLLESICRADDGCRVAQLAWLTPSEREQLLVGWNDTAREFADGRVVHSLFEEHADLDPDSIAVVAGDTRWSYRELNQQANRLAHFLREAGVGSGTLVGLHLERGPALIVAMLATLKAGGAYLPLDADYPAERLRFMIRDSGCAVVLTEVALEPRLPPTAAEHLCLDSLSEVLAAQPDTNPAALAPPAGESAAERRAYLMYTSGSTGQPKGVEISHRAIVALVGGMRELFALHRDAVVAQASPASFDPATGEIWGALLSGARLVIVPTDVLYAPTRLQELILSERITSMMIVTALLHEYAARLPEAFAGLEALMFGGEAADPAAVQRILASRPPKRLLNSYGPTETTLMATCYEVPRHSGDASAHGGLPDAVPIGRPLPNVRIYLLDESLNPVPIGTVGEIYIGGTGLARGYLNRPEATSERFVPDPFGPPGAQLYRTGDNGRYRLDGNLVFAGRRDEQLKVRGFRVEPAEIEAALHVCPGVARSVVVARTFASSSEKHLVAYLLALDDAARPGAAELRERLRQVLPAQLIPSAFLYIDAFPLMPSGKVDRSALPDPDTHERPRLEQVAPRSPIEQMLREIWVEVLGHSDFGIHDNFFELGGHSLLATQVVSRVRHTLQVELPLRALFEAPTIATLAERAAQRRLPGAPVELRPISILPRDRPLPTSFSQRRMWLIQQLEPESTAYNMPFALRVRGPLDARALAAALAVIVQRHEAFRTRFLISNGEPMQLIAATGEDELNEVDLRHLPETERAAEAARLCGAEARRPFDLSRAPLHRFMLLRLGDADYTFLLHMHHAVSDQWSAGILARELAYLYVTFKEGKTPVLEPLRVQYADFAAWQREQIGDALLAPQLAYWRERLQGIRTLTLQTDRPRPAQQTFRGSHLSAPIPPATLAALKALGARLGATPFMTLLAAFKVLLARYCNEEDIAVGTPIANRTRIETEPLVGTLVNTLVMRTSLAGDPTFAELLGRVRDTALDAYAHQDLPFERLVEELAATRDTSHAPLVQVLFNVPNAPMGTLGFDGLDLDVFEFDAGSAQFDLSLTVDTEQFDRVSLAYSTELFDATSAQRMLDHYLMLIESVVADPERRIATFDLLSAKEKALILGDWNRTAAAYPGELRTDQLIAAQAQRTPASVAVGMGHRNVTYRQLDQRANQLAHWLTRNGASSGAIVGVHLDRSLDLVAVLLGVMKAGATYVPLDPSFPPERLQAMAIDAGLALLLTRSDLPQPVPEMSDRMLFLDQCGAQISCEPTTPPEVRTPPDALAYILYTSGSTGTPKGVEIPHRALTNFLCSMQSQPGCSAGDTMLAVTTLSFDIAALEIYLPLMAGARVELASSQEVSDGRLLRERLEACRPTIMQATPATWRMLIEAGWSGSPSLTVLCGGEGLPRDLADKLLERCSSLWNLYGPTETTVWSTQQRIEPDTAQVGIGRPIANTSVYILDKEMRPVPVGVPGEIFIGGHGVARGYRNRPELTAERFVADPFSVVPGARLYRTGDLARWLPDGRIVHLGRLDSQVKVRGFRIELGEIDSVLARHPRVAQAVTTTRCDASGVMQLVAYVVSRGAEPPSLSDLRASLRASLPEYMVPSQFVFLDALPLTANRKVDVKALPAPATARPRDAHVEPRGRLEVQLMALWRQVLGHDEVGIHDNFFDLGGHSLQAVQLMAFIEQVTGRQLPLATLFRAPTVAALARLLAQTNWTPQWRALVAIQPLGRKTPLFAIPGVGGNVLMFARLSKLLGPDQPFFGLQARGLDSTDEPFTSIVKMAAHYVGEIRSMQPSGPYIVAGTCTGGVIAYEVAQQLMKSGERVILMLLETWHPTSARRSWRLAAPVFPIRFLWGRLIMWRRALASMPLQQWPAFLAAKARNVGTSIRGVTAHDVEVPSYYPERVVRSTWHAIAHYAPIAYAGRLLNVTAGRRPLGPQAVDTRKLWEKLATGGSRTITTPAEDSGRLFVSPHVEELAGHIERYILAELSRGGSRQPPTSHEIGATMQAPPA